MISELRRKLENSGELWGRSSLRSNFALSFSCLGLTDATEPNFLPVGLPIKTVHFLVSKLVLLKRLPADLLLLQVQPCPTT